MVRFSRIKYRCLHCKVEFHLHETNYPRLCQPCGMKDDERLTMVEYLLANDRSYTSDRKKLCEDVEGLEQEDIIRWIKENRLQVSAGGGLRSTANASDVSDQMQHRLDIMIAQNKNLPPEAVEAAPLFKGMATADILEALGNRGSGGSVIMGKFQRGAEGPPSDSSE